MGKTEEEQGAKFVRWMTGLLIGCAVALAVCLLFLFLASIGISEGWIQDDLMYQLTVVGCVVGCFFGTLVSMARCGGRGLVVGLAVGAIFFLILMSVSVLFFQGVSWESGGVGLLCGALCGGAVAGILGRKKAGGKRLSKSKKNVRNHNKHRGK